MFITSAKHMMSFVHVLTHFLTNLLSPPVSETEARDITRAAAHLHLANCPNGDGSDRALSDKDLQFQSQ